MEHSALLGPVVALVGWSIVMLIWAAVARGAQFRKLGITMDNIPQGARGVDFEGRAEPKAQWKSHNYNHLMEQPTIFYAIIFALILMKFDHQINVWLAWGYVAFRIAHSIVQSSVNIVKYRLPLFLGATLCLASLTIHAALRLI